MLVRVLSRLLCNCPPAFFSCYGALAWLSATIVVATCRCAPAGPLQGGAAVVDVTPRVLPVIQNGGFLESQADQIADPIFARCVVLADDDTIVALVVVDSCMIPLDVCDRVKSIATRQSGIPADRILISATHTHSAPSVMDYCLGSRADADYREWLPGQIARSIVEAKEKLQPVQAGWRTVDAGPYTKCRRWITRTDKLLQDPFGASTVHATMHPGHLNSDFCGPAGPVDPWLSLLSVRTLDGRPLVLFANFAMHYYGSHPGISSDYFGLFCQRLAERLRADDPRSVVAIMSQGCSGDAWWGDYSVSADRQRFQKIDEFTNGLVDLASTAYETTDFSAQLPLEMAEMRLTLRRRTPDNDRLTWAQRLNAQRGTRLPNSVPEVYALQSVYLHEHPEEEVVLQAVRLGDLGIVGMPNEVYSLSGLKLKEQSPLAATIAVSLANGASGYIPPPEQHALGGYTTWPARTAGLEVQAEPKIIDGVLTLLEQLAGRPRHHFREAETSYSRTIQASHPIAYWRLGELNGPQFDDASGKGSQLSVLGPLAFHLPGREGAALGQAHASHAVHLAGGKLVATRLEIGESYTIEMFFYLATPTDFRSVTGTLFQRGDDKLIVTGVSSEPSQPESGRLQAGSLVGHTRIVPGMWHHLVLVRNGDFLEAYLNGADEPEFSGKQPLVGTLSPMLTFGGGEQNATPWEGKLDEVIVFERALPADEIERHFLAAAEPSESSPSHKNPSILSEPLDAEASLRQWRVRDGYRVELVAAEPLVQDPVALDWGFDGRLWIAEMADYPLGMDGAGKTGGRIRWLKDTDGDGKYDTSQLFLDGVSFPNGVMAWGNGVLVTAAPEIFYAVDTDGDGVADRRETLFSGFIAGNQQLRVNGLRWGFDNWIYCASGSHHAGFGAETTLLSHRTGERILLGSRDFRFRVHSGQLEPESGPSQYGRVRDDWGNWFGVQNSQPLWHYVLSDRYLRRNAEVAPIDPRKQLRSPAMPRVFAARPPQKRYHGFDHAGHYTSACGISIYRDNHLFSEEETTYAFTCEPFHNLVQRHAIRPNGTSFDGERADDGPIDFLASADGWTRPVMTRTGPDGALWVVDMYRYMIEHPEFLPDKGREEMAPRYRAGEKMGRIYRVVPVERGVARPIPQLDQLTPLELVSAIDSPNGELRDLVHRRLLHIMTAEDLAVTTNALRQLLRTTDRAATRLQILGVLAGLDAIDAELLLETLIDSHASVRRFAIVLAEKFVGTDAPQVREKVLRMADDEDAYVRLQLACSLGEWSEPVAGRTLAQLAQQAESDPFQTAAVMSSAGRHYSALVDYVAQHRDSVSQEMVLGLLEMGSSRRDDMARLLESLLTTPVVDLHSTDQTAALMNPSAMHILSLWLDSLSERGLNWTSFHRQTISDDRLDAEFDQLGRKTGQVRGWLASQLSMERSLDDADLVHVLAAISWLGRDSAYAAGDLELASMLLAPRWPGDAQLAALRMLGRLESDAVPVTLWSNWRALLPVTRAAAVDLLISRPAFAMALLQSLVDGDGPVSLQDVSLVQRQQLLRSSDEEISRLAGTVFVSGASSSRRDVLATNSSALTLVGNVERGAKIFQQQCTVCHNMVGKSVVGPDLRGVTNRHPDALLTAILDPSQTVEPRYQNYVAVLKSGELVQGLIARESTQAIEFSLPDGTRRTVLRTAIEELQRLSASLMPDGFEGKIDVQGLADVIAYVAGLDRITGE